MDFVKIKKIIISALALPVLYFFILNINTFVNQPDIKKITIPDMTAFSFNSNENQINKDNTNVAKLLKREM